jgi:hypothetical protein
VRYGDLTRAGRVRVTVSLTPEHVESLVREFERRRNKSFMRYWPTRSEMVRVVLLEQLQALDASAAAAASAAPPATTKKKRYRPSDDPDKIGRRA